MWRTSGGKDGEETLPFRFEVRVPEKERTNGQALSPGVNHGMLDIDDMLTYYYEGNTIKVGCNMGNFCEGKEEALMTSRSEKIKLSQTRHEDSGRKNVSASEPVYRWKRRTRIGRGNCIWSLRERGRAGWRR